MARKRSPIFICFTGMDGTGKTSLSNNTVSWLNSNGVMFKYVYARLNPFILKPFMIVGNRIFLRKKNIFRDYNGYTTKKRDTIKKHSFLYSIYLKILLFDYALQILYKVKLPLMMGKNIVCDRYIYDTIITDLSADLNYSKENIVSALNGLHRYFPKPDLIILIDVPEEVAFKRKTDVPSVDYLRERRMQYLEMGKEYNAAMFDGNMPLEELNGLIQKRVKVLVEPV